MNAEMISEWIAGGFILLGTVLTLLSGVGLIRLPDVYTRSHAASKSTTLGGLFILLGAFMFFWIDEGYFSIRLLLGIFFVFLTAPVAGHIICRAAYRSNVKLADRTVRDDLKKYMKTE
mgnify:FL=1